MILVARYFVEDANNRGGGRRARRSARHDLDGRMLLLQEVLDRQEGYRAADRNRLPESGRESAAHAPPRHHAGRAEEGRRARQWSVRCCLQGYLEA